MKRGTWRDIARPIIARVLADNKHQDETTIRKALRNAYPFGERQYHPYKIWLNEIHRQRGHKKAKRKTIDDKARFIQLQLFE